MDKKKVLIVCALGMSSSLLVTRTQEVAKKRNVDVIIESDREANVRTHLDSFSVVLLGPQIRHLLGKIQKAAEGKDIRVEMIEMSDYGRLDGNAVLDQILELI